MSSGTYFSGSEINTTYTCAADTDGIAMSTCESGDSMSEAIHSHCEEDSTCTTDSQSSTEESHNHLSAAEKACIGLKEFRTPLYEHADITVLDSYFCSMTLPFDTV